MPKESQIVNDFLKDNMEFQLVEFMVLGHKTTETCPNAKHSTRVN